jgi:hypothetical protein
VGSAEIRDIPRFDTPEDAETAAYAALKRLNGNNLLREAES